MSIDDDIAPLPVVDEAAPANTAPANTAAVMMTPPAQVLVPPPGPARGGGTAPAEAVSVLPAAPGHGGRAAPRPEEPAPQPGRPVQDWRPFLRALAEEIDAVAGAAGRDALLRGVGLQLARMYPLPARESPDALAMEMTETLEGFGWGRVRISYSERERCLFLTHEGLPRVGGGGNPPGTWLAGVLEGLYGGWMAQQAGTDETLVARRVESSRPEAIVIRYGQE